MTATTQHPKPHKTRAKNGALIGLSLAALGIVYGDIGTSPLYAINEIFFGKAKLGESPSNITGLISVVVWALIIIVAIKYVVLILRADNDGEGGVFALLALLKRHKTKTTIGLVVLLTFAAGLLFGDGVITPAISVLSAVEGLKVVAPSLTKLVIPITLGILAALFIIQRQGTAKIGKVFGPIILVWFVAIAALGVHQIIMTPEILHALNPVHAAEFIIKTKPYELLIALGSVMLVVTGGEALYADMGHFGRSPIRLSWFSVVMPCLILNYLGQGAFLLSGHPVSGDNLFFSLVPHALLLPMVVLATASTVIASQALISGCFSLAAQGIALGLLPRLRIKQTHKEHAGQIYLGAINWGLFVGCVALVVSFRTSSNLAAAYGLAVSAVMLLTAISAMQVARLDWKWPKFAAYGLFGMFAVVDTLFFAANSLKFLKGGFVPVLIGLIFFIVMRTWQWGKSHVRSAFLEHSTMSIRDLLAMGEHSERLKQSVLILTIHNPKEVSSPVPPLAKLFVQRFKAVPQHLILLTVSQTRRPYVDESERYSFSIFENDRSKDSSIISVHANFGFMEEPDVEKVIKDIAKDKTLTADDDMKDWIIYAGRERVLPAEDIKGYFKKLRVSLYSFLFRNTSPSYEYYGMGNDARLSVELLPVRIK
jgi:KUP system potassium uptake protein